MRENKLRHTTTIIILGV